MQVKRQQQNAPNETAGGGVSNNRKKKSRGGGGGPEAGLTVFEQMVGKMSVLTPESLLLPHRVWKVKFVGESVDDCGGGYRYGHCQVSK